MDIIVAKAAADRVRERVAALGLPVELIVVGDDGAADSDLREAIVFFQAGFSNAVYRRVLSDAPNIRWVHTASAGIDPARRALCRA